MPRQVQTTGQFEKDVARAVRRGKDMAKLKAVIELLVSGQPLPRALRDHPLKGDYKGTRNLHIEPDWLLLYQANATTLILVRTGTHADLF